MFLEPGVIAIRGLTYILYNPERRTLAVEGSRAEEVLATLDEIEAPLMLTTVKESQLSWSGRTLAAIVKDALKNLGVPVISVEMRHSESLGLYALALLDCDMGEALRRWPEIADVARELGVPIFVAWTRGGEMPPEEAGAYVGRALAKMGVFLQTEGPVDVLEALREERGRGQWGGRGGDYL